MVKVEQRKIMALGQSSRAITLPKPWLERNKLEQGDKVSFYIQHNGSLVLHPSERIRDDVRKINIIINANENGDSIVRKIIGSYLNGYTIIKIKSEKVFTEEQQKAIRKIVGTLYMMIIESEASGMVLETLIDESKVSVSSGIERMHIITYSMCQDILQSMKKWDMDLVKSVLSIENDVDQLMFFLLRLIRGAAIDLSLANQLGIDFLDCLDYQTIVHRIERIADHTVNMASSVIALIESNLRIPDRVMSTLIRAAEIAFTSYDMAVQGYLSKDLTSTHEIVDKEKEIGGYYQEITPLPIFGEPCETSILSHVIAIREGIMGISHLSADIAELTMDRAYKSENINSARELRILY